MDKKFQREERYIVIKLTDINPQQHHTLMSVLGSEQIRTRDAVVVEKDWPEYEHVWKMIEHRVVHGEHVNLLTYYVPGSRYEASDGGRLG
jgi:hypothetical protein